MYNYICLHYFNTYLHDSLIHVYTYVISINKYPVIWLQNIHFATTVHMPLIKQVRGSCIDAQQAAKSFAKVKILQLFADLEKAASGASGACRHFAGLQKDRYRGTSGT